MRALDSEADGRGNACFHLGLDGDELSIFGMVRHARSSTPAGLGGAGSSGMVLRGIIRHGRHSHGGGPQK